MTGLRSVPRWRLLAVALAVAAVAVAIGVAIGRGIGGNVSSGARLLTTRPAPPGGAAAGDFVEVHDAPTGVTIGLPPTWHRLPASDPSVRLVATGGVFGSLLLRSVQLPAKLGRPEAGAAQQELTRRLVTSNRAVRVLEGPKPIELGGLRGWFYFYTFKDAGGLVGAHSHYFLFKGGTLITLVLQALPATRFAGLSSTFDRISSTFRGTS